MALGGSKQSKSAQQQGWAAVADQLVGSLASKLTIVIGIGLLCSCAYVVLLVTSRSCWSYGASGAAYCKDAAGCSLLNASAAYANLDEEISSSLSVHQSKEPGSRSTISLDEVRKETSLDRIVFGIGASAHLWVNRSQFINLWWKQGYTRGYIWFDRDLGQDWKPNDPPYKVSEDTTPFRYTHRTGHKAAIRISRIVSESFRLGLTDVDWFVMGDDDTFFFTDNLVRVLSKYDPKQLWYIGSNSEDHIQNQLFSYNMAYGGGGFAISYALAEVLAEKQDDCLERYPWLFGSDDRMKACMSELGVPLTKEPGFHQFDVRGDVRGLLAAHPMSPIISLHHLEAIYPLFPGEFTRATAIAHIMKAVNLAPDYIFQQSICYDNEKRWSFSVSWGYVVHAYKGFVPPNKLEVPTLTFLSWHRRRESFAFPLNTRPREREICEEPSAFYMEEADRMEGGKLRTVYNNADRINRISVCKQRNLPLSLIKNVLVESEPVGPDWLMNPRRQCCRIADMEETSIKIDVGPCGEGESLVPDDIPVRPVRKAGRKGNGNANRGGTENADTKDDGNAGKKEDSKAVMKDGGDAVTKDDGDSVRKDDGVANRKVERVANSREDGTVKRKEGGTVNREERGTATGRDEGTANKKEVRTTIRKDEGTAIRKEEGTADRKDEGTAVRKDEGVVNRKADGIVTRKTAEKV